MPRLAIQSIVLCLLSCPMGFVASAFGNNLLLDSDCENRTESSPWAMFPIRGIAKGSVTHVAGGRSGYAQCLELTEAMDGWTQLSAEIPGGIKAGEDYELRAWLRGDRPMHAIGLLVHDNTHWFPTDYATTGANVDHKWSEHVLKFRAGKTDPKARVGIRLFNEGRLWVDDITFSVYQPAPKPPIEGNKVHNGSFELGWLGWTGVSFVQNCEKLDDAPHGNRCLRFNVFNSGHISSILMPADEGHTHQISLAIKSNAPTQIRLTLESGYAPLAPVGPETISDGPSTVALTELLDVNQDWRTYDFKVELPPVPSSAFYIRLRPKDSTVFWLDRVQFRADGRFAQFNSRLPVEGRLEFTNNDAIFTQGEAVTGNLTLWNEDQLTNKVAVLRIFDLWERVISETRIDLELPQGESTTNLKLGAPKNGVFRAELRMMDSPSQLIAEGVFAVLPATKMHDPIQSAFGTHVDFASPKKPS